MSYEQRAGPSTPGRSLPPFGRPSESLHTQARTSSGSGGGAGNDSGVLRSSSLRSTPGPHAAQSSFEYGGMREMSTPKSVRWEDAPSSPPQKQSAVTPAQQQQPSVHFPFSLQYSGSQQQLLQQQQSAPLQQQQQGQQGQVQNFQPWSSSAATPPAQRTSPNSSIQRSFSSSFSASGPSQNQTSSLSSSVAQPLGRSVFNSTAAPTMMVSRPSAIAKPSLATSSQMPQNATEKAAVVTRSYPAIVSRIKWNTLALFIAWLGPRIGPMGRLYWVALDVAFSVFGGDADVYLSSAFAWFHRASLLILIINVVEATIMLNTASNSPEDTPGTAQTKRKPSLAFPPNRVVSASAPASSSPLAKNKSNTPHHYAQGSPLRDSIFRASVTAQGLGEGRRLPSQTPRLSSSTRQESNATPLAAFLARKQEQRMTSGGDVGDVSWTGGDVDLSTDSIEVDRALRAFSAGYEREMSQSVIPV